MNTAQASFRAILILVLACLFLGCHMRRDLADSDSVMTGTSMLWGKVVDEQGQPVPGAELRLSGPSLCGTRLAETDLDGYYFMPQLPPGQGNKLNLRALGYATQTLAGVEILSGASLRINFVAPITICIEVHVAPTMIDNRTVVSGAIVQYDSRTGMSAVHFP